MTQLNFIRNELMNNGRISRNFCLRNFISRLGARIDDLKKGGLKIEGKWVNTDYGRDFVYYLQKDSLIGNQPQNHTTGLVGAKKAIQGGSQEPLFKLNRHFN